MHQQLLHTTPAALPLPDHPTASPRIVRQLRLAGAQQGGVLRHQAGRIPQGSVGEQGQHLQAALDLQEW